MFVSSPFYLLTITSKTAQQTMKRKKGVRQIVVPFLAGFSSALMFSACPGFSWDRVVFSS